MGCPTNPTPATAAASASASASAMTASAPAPPRHPRTVTRDELLILIRAAADTHGDRLTLPQFRHHSGLGRAVWTPHFRTWKECKKAAGLSGLRPVGRPRKATDEQLLRDIHRVAGIVGRVPNLGDLYRHGRHGKGPINRWKYMRDVQRAYADWLRKRDTAEFRAEHTTRDAVVAEVDYHVEMRTVPHHPQGHVYGEALGHSGFRHAPTNEAGVMILFGVMSAELGFAIEAVHAAFPDAEVKRRRESARNTWERLRVEFEFESRNFHHHGHDPAACDLIICWSHNWPDCPLPVLELKRELEKQHVPARKSSTRRKAVRKTTKRVP